MARSRTARAIAGRRIISVSLPHDQFERVAEAADLVGKPMSRFVADAGAELAARTLRQAARKPPAATDDDQPVAA